MSQLSPSPVPAIDHKKLSLVQLLSNPLILFHTTAHLSVPSLLSLASTCKGFQSLLYSTPLVFHRVDLSAINSVQFERKSVVRGGEVWRNFQLDENLTEDEIYSGPLRVIFASLERQHILQDVSTLILDGLSVTSELVGDIILSASFNVNLLSIREVTNLNSRKLMQALEYAVRPSRPSNTPRLRGLYIFGPKDSNFTPGQKFQTQVSSYPPGEVELDKTSSLGVVSSLGAQIGAEWNQKSEGEMRRLRSVSWYGKSGDMTSKMSRNQMTGWAETMQACKGVISFDAILCNGPRHLPSTRFGQEGSEGEAKAWYEVSDAYLSSSVATVAVGGCASCNTAPEGYLTYGTTRPENLPLLSPPPLYSSTTREATRPSPSTEEHPPRILARCNNCLEERYCRNCWTWWCESCYETDSASTGRAVPLEQKHKHISHPSTNSVKVHMGLCIENCLVGEMMFGAGSNGMWG